jgi:hypothetical protein
MKTARKALWTMAGLTAFSAAVMSGQISTLTTFSDGDVLTAAELNDNNTAIMAAVNDNNSYHKIYVLGDIGPAGGLVFHIENGGRNGLEAAPEDQDDGSGAVWGCPSREVNGADGVLIERGTTNTLDVVEQCTGVNIASKLAYDYVSLTGYTDWFLPSKDELNAMYINLDLEDSGDFTDNSYWSSSESSETTAWAQGFISGQQSELYSKALSTRVRAVRAF